jgi:adenylate cyclase
MLGVGVATLVVVVRTLGGFQALELGEYDRIRSRLVAFERESEPSRAIVVWYSERDVTGEIGFPLSDEKLTAALEAILADGPRGIGVDFFRDLPIPPGSEELADLIRRDQRIVMIHQLATANDRAVAPPDAIGPAQAGLADLVPDTDGHVRRAIVYLDDPEFGTALSLALQLALRHLAVDGIGLSAAPSDEPMLMLGDTPLPRFRGDHGGYVRADDAGYQTLVQYADASPRETLDLTAVMQRDFEPGLFRDRMVFIGATAHTHTDLRSTPLGDWPGILIHAQVAEQLVRFARQESAPLRTLSNHAEVVWIFLWALLGGGIAFWRGALITSISSTAIGLVMLFGIVLAAHAGGWWIPGVPAAAAGIGANGLAIAYLARREHLERRELMLLFSRHISSRLANSIWQHREEFSDGGRPRPQRVTATVLFLDMKGFTEVAEKLDTLEVMEWLNDFMGTMAHEAERYGGLVDDYFGDGMKIDFGVPVPSITKEDIDADAANAVFCGLSMGRQLERLNQEWDARGLPQSRMRIGIATGRAVAGSLGERDRLKFTVVGDTVNTAARLESLNAGDVDFGPQPCRILISEETLGRIGDQFETVDRGSFGVKGKTKRVRVHQVIRSRIEDPSVPNA